MPLHQQNIQIGLRKFQFLFLTDYTDFFANHFKLTILLHDIF